MPGIVKRLDAVRPRLHSPGAKHQYARQLRDLRQLETHLGTGHPEWPVVEAAREVLGAAIIASELNGKLQAKHPRARRRLVSTTSGLRGCTTRH